MKQNHIISLYQYLEASGVLTSGIPEKIEAAKRQHRKEYKRLWRRNKRRNEKSVTLSWSIYEMGQMKKNAHYHHLPVTKYCKACITAYQDKIYLIPNQAEVRKIKQLLALCYNEIVELLDEDLVSKEVGKQACQKIFDLEGMLLPALHHPQTIEQWYEEVRVHHPNLKALLLQFLETK